MILSPIYATKFHKRLNVKQTQKLVPGLETEGLICGYLYQDCQTNDARLVMEVAKSATSYGACMANYLQVTGFLKEGNHIVGVEAHDLITDSRINVCAKQVVNATGVWMDELCILDDVAVEPKIRPAKGVHIIIARERIPTQTALLFESAAKDGRSLFFIPWYEGIIIGTTDTDYKGKVDTPQAEQTDVEYILAAINHIFPKARLTNKDILSSYAGLRPLINVGNKSTKDISREHRMFQSGSGLISIAGGKLTTYRRMAAEVVDKVIAQLKPSIKMAKSITTKEVFLSGLENNQLLDTLREELFAQAQQLELDEKVVEHLLSDYGANARELLKIVSAQPKWKTRLLSHLPFIQAEVIYAVRAEQASCLDDFLVRRSRIALLTYDQGVSCIDDVAQLMAQELGWSEREIPKKIKHYKEEIAIQYKPAF